MLEITSDHFRIGFYNLYNIEDSPLEINRRLEFFKSLGEIKLKEPAPAELHLYSCYPAVQVVSSRGTVVSLYLFKLHMGRGPTVLSFTANKNE